MWGNHKKEINGFNADTTNNKMELTAVIEAIKADNIDSLNKNLKLLANNITIIQ